MIVFSNTTPFIALASIDQLDLLPQLFNQIHVAKSVIEECAEGGRIPVPDLRSLDWIVPIEDEASAGLPFLFELDRGEKKTKLFFSPENLVRARSSSMNNSAAGLPNTSA